MPTDGGIGEPTQPQQHMTVILYIVVGIFPRLSLGLFGSYSSMRNKGTLLRARRSRSV
jgi:nitrate reductase NapE component